VSRLLQHSVTNIGLATQELNRAGLANVQKEQTQRTVVKAVMVEDSGKISFVKRLQ